MNIENLTSSEPLTEEWCIAQGFGSDGKNMWCRELEDGLDLECYFRTDPIVLILKGPGQEDADFIDVLEFDNPTVGMVNCLLLAFEGRK